MDSRPYHYLQPNPILMQAFRTTEQEIQLNRTGSLSSKQVNSMWAEKIPRLVGLGLLWICFAVLYVSFRNSYTDEGSANVLEILMFGSVGVIVFYVYYNWRILKASSAKTAVGIAQVEWRDGRYGGIFLLIDGRRFRLKPVQVNALSEGQTYAAYYVDHKKRLLSIERVAFKDVGQF